jgi:adenine-specific DNA-methyltransferase
MTNETLKVDLESQDLVAARLESFMQLFPGVLVDGVLDVTQLGEALNRQLTQPADGRERYGLQWAGKLDALRSLLKSSRGALVPDLPQSIDFETAQNVFVEGDNLEVLKLLQKAYNDKIKLIYIDPPYNTGNDFVYADDFADGLRRYLEYTGQIDADGNRTSAAAETTGRRHSRWLSMIYPRLVLARNLLTPDGVIAVSIDDNEVANLRSVLDEVFGPENFVNTFVWVSNLKGRQISGSGAVGTKEYIHVYARNIEAVGTFRASAAQLKAMMPNAYKGFDYKVESDQRGPYVLKNELHNTNSVFNEETRPNLVYDIYFHPKTHEVKTEPVSSAHIHVDYVKIGPKTNNNGVHKYHAFRWSRQKVADESYDLAFVESRSGDYKVYTKVRDVDSTAVKDIILDISTNEGSRDLESLGIDPEWFDYPKPVRLIQLFVAFGADPDSIVLDFFAGSGTAAHAVALQNSADGGQRRVISVNIAEPTPQGSEARKGGLDTVADVTVRRLTAVAETVSGASERGLRVFRLRPSNFVQAAENLDELTLRVSTLKDAPPDWLAVAAEVLVQEGVALDRPWERHKIAGTEIVVSDGVAVVLAATIDDEIVNAAFGLAPRVVVLLEDGFADADAVKANAVTKAKDLGITLKTV